MATTYWLDDIGTLTLETEEATPTATPVAGIQDVAITPSVSIEQLYTADSIKINTQKQHEFSVDVSIGYSVWDVTLAEQWLGGGGGTSANSMTDTSDPQKFGINSVDFTGEDGTSLTISVENITFEEMPLVDASRGEYVQWDLSGTGEDITDASTV